MADADALVIESPLYFKIPARLTAFMERLVCLAFFHEVRGFVDAHPLDGKPCGLVAVAADDDPRSVLETLFNFALSLRLNPITMKHYLYFGVGGRGKVQEDTDLKPIENALLMGKLLVGAVSGKAT
jgi:multimeric flavodoxin WrbA